MELVTARSKRHGKHEWKTVPRLGAAARRRARRWVALTAMAPVLLVPTTLMGASSSFLAEPRQPVDPDPRELGVSGNLPQAPLLSPDVLERAADPQQLATGAEPQVELPTGPLGIPAAMLAAYVKAAGQADRGCGLHWSVLASIGRIESGHARSGSVDVLGTTVRAVLGPRLSGGPGIAAIPDTDAGRYDGDPVWDRAVGPMQFIPSTWNKFAVDGNDDGVASPHNIHDASLAAARYLCSGGGDLRNAQGLAAAVFRYNHSDSYVRTVLIWASAYEKGVTPTPSELAPEVGDVLDGERLPDGPPVLAMGPAAPPAQAPAPASAPPAAPAPTGPLPPAPESRPAEPQISVTPPEIPQPSPPDIDPPAATPPNSPSSAQPGVPPALQPAPPSSMQPGSPPALQPAPPSSAQPGVPPAPQPAPPNSTQPGPPPNSTQPGPPPGATQPGPAPDSTQPGSPPPAQPGPPPAADPATPPGTPQDPPPAADQPGAPPPESTSPPPSTPDEAPKACDPAVLANGEFATGEASPGTVLGPGASDPHAAVPGQTVYVDQGTAGLLKPCVVPDGFVAPAQ
ncbi:lytic murein transglycosylase [Saccharopolyspora sp. NPDC050389]|uniref:lytic murein transglycosylase n=1 Tax=Saccharopolyspora sp. NPDC050389 TaxID=3155516 RepID=UPI0033E3370A